MARSCAAAICDRRLGASALRDYGRRTIAPVGVRLVQMCESLCGELRSAVGPTVFRIELDRRATPLVITLRSDVPGFDPSNERMRPPVPARIQLVLLDRDRRIGELRIEDERRGQYPPDAIAELERIAARCTREIAQLIGGAQPPRAARPPRAGRTTRAGPRRCSAAPCPTRLGGRARAG